MGIQVGDIDITKQAIESDFMIMLIDTYLEWVIKENNLKKPTAVDLEKMKEEIIKKLQAKYPNMGIKKT